MPGERPISRLAGGFGTSNDASAVTAPSKHGRSGVSPVGSTAAELSFGVVLVLVSACVVGPPLSPLQRPRYLSASRWIPDFDGGFVWWASKFAIKVAA